jgi:hypothetical protein
MKKTRKKVLIESGLLPIQTNSCYKTVLDEMSDKNDLIWTHCKLNGQAD